jgi:hypothetical protein
MKKVYLYLTLILILSLSFNCVSFKKVKEDEPKKWKYFKILADADDDRIFIKLQDDLGIDPKLERYTVVVDIRDKNANLHYIVFGDIESSSPPKFPWSRLSKEVQDGLINWTGDSKENLQ